VSASPWRFPPRTEQEERSATAGAHSTPALSTRGSRAAAADSTTQQQGGRRQLDTASLQAALDSLTAPPYLYLGTPLCACVCVRRNSSLSTSLSLLVEIYSSTESRVRLSAVLRSRKFNSSLHVALARVGVDVPPRAALQLRSVDIISSSEPKGHRIDKNNMAKQVCRGRRGRGSRSRVTATPPEGVARGILIGARIAKRFDVPTPSPRRTKTGNTKKRRGRPPKNAPSPRPETPPPTVKEIYYGTVTGYNHLSADYDHHDNDVGLYRVHYDDGDTEVTDPDEMYAAFLLHNAEMIRMDIERSKSYPVLASKIAPSWREGTAPSTGGGAGLAHQRDLREDELIVLDAERIGYWESYKAYNLSTGVDRPVPFSPTPTCSGNRSEATGRTGGSLHSRRQGQDASVAGATIAGEQTAGEFSGSNEVVQPSTSIASGSARSMAARRSERAITSTAVAAIAQSPTPRRNKRRGPEAAVASAAAVTAVPVPGSSKRRKKASDTTTTTTTTSSSSNSNINNNLSGRGHRQETTIRVKEEPPAANNGHGWGLFRWLFGRTQRQAQIVGFGDICDLT
jgi:hypothetical protein